MFRAALLRSARSSAARVVRQAAPIARPAASNTFAVVPRSSPIAFQAVRSYSAAAGLKPEEIQGRILDILRNFDKVTDVEKLTPTAHFTNDLGLDSLDTVEVVMAIEEEFSIEIPDKDADTINSVDKAIEYISHQPDAH